jgi:hypothetical protein
LAAAGGFVHGGGVGGGNCGGVGGGGIGGRWVVAVVGLAVADSAEVLALALDGWQLVVPCSGPSQGHSGHGEEYFCYSKVLELRQNRRRKLYMKNIQKPNPKRAIQNRLLHDFA